MKERDGPNKVSYWVVDSHKHLTGESKRVTTTKQQKGEASMKANIEVKSVVTATPGYPMWAVLRHWPSGDGCHRWSRPRRSGRGSAAGGRRSGGIPAEVCEPIV
jgi:hypothetical protein